MSTIQQKSVYNDTRLQTRELEMLEGFIHSGSSVIHNTFKDYNEQTSCYRFILNPKVTESILINNLKEKCAKSTINKDVLVILDTTKVCIDRYKKRITDFEGVGIISSNQYKPHYGFLLHPLYVIDEHDSTPYGIADVVLFNRPMKSNPLSIKERSHNQYKLPIEKKESIRWLSPCIESKDTTLSKANRVTYIMDREADMWEIYDRLPQENINFVVRVKENRRIENEQGATIKIKDQLNTQTPQGRLDIEYKDDDGINKRTQATIKWSKCHIKSPSHKKGPSAGPIYCIEVKGVKSRKSKKVIHWLVWTNYEVRNLEEAKKIIAMYVKRWEVEVYFKLLKTDGFDIENCQLEKGTSIRKLTLMIMDAALKTQQLKAARTGDTSLQVSEVFTEQEAFLLVLLNKKVEGKTEKQKNPYPVDHLSWATWIIARLAGWKDFYGNKSPPGNKTIQKGMEKFNYLFVGYSMAN